MSEHSHMEVPDELVSTVAPKAEDVAERLACSGLFRSFLIPDSAEECERRARIWALYPSICADLTAQAKARAAILFLGGMGDE